MTNIATENPPIFKNGKPSISMGHLYHGYVSHNERVSVTALQLQELQGFGPLMCPMMSNYTSWGCELLRLQHGQKALRITAFLWSLCGRQHGATQQFGALRYTCHTYIYIYHVYSSLSKIPAPKGVWFGLYIPASSSHDKLMPASIPPKYPINSSTSPKDRHVFF